MSSLCLTWTSLILTRPGIPAERKVSIALVHNNRYKLTSCCVGVNAGFEVDLAEKVAWAERNPDRIKRIVREANAFARKYLSKQGQQCFAMQILDGYARMLQDVWKLQKLRHRAEPVNLPTDLSASNDPMSHQR